MTTTEALNRIRAELNRDIALREKYLDELRAAGNGKESIRVTDCMHFGRLLADYDLLKLVGDLLIEEALSGNGTATRPLQE